jgi:hydroxymethylbilane synthase
VPDQRRPSGESRQLRLASRGSPLARYQAALVADLLRRADPSVDVVVEIVRTEGDRQATVPLDRIGGQGIFTKEIQAAVLDGRADVAVHSAKDLPSVTPDGLVLAAVPERADPRDALVGHRLTDLPAGAVVATGSARRRAQLANLRPDLTFVDLRGNMATRLARAVDGSVDAVVAAAAALDRLGWDGAPVDRLPVSVLLPQAGQGALALEGRAGDDATLALLARVDDVAAHRAVRAERAMLAAVEGSCSVPVAAWAEPADPSVGGSGSAIDAGGPIRLHGLLASGDGRVVVRAALTGDDPDALGRELARYLLEDCGGRSVEGWVVEGWTGGEHSGGEHSGGEHSGGARAGGETAR